MRSRLGVRLARFIAIGIIAVAGLMPSVASAGEEELVLRVGTDQELLTLNPWNSYSVADYEMFQVQYELLVSFDINLQPTAGLRRRVGDLGRRDDPYLPHPRGHDVVGWRAGDVRGRGILVGHRAQGRRGGGEPRL